MSKLTCGSTSWRHHNTKELLEPLTSLLFLGLHDSWIMRWGSWEDSTAQLVWMETSHNLNKDGSSVSMHEPKWKCVSFVQLRWLVSYPLQGHVRNSFQATIVNRQADSLMTSAPYIHTFHSGFLSFYFSLFVKMQNLRKFLSGFTHF